MAELTSKREQCWSYLVLVLPGILIYLFVMAFPTVLSVLLSLTNYNGGPVFGNRNIKITGISSYLQVFQDRYFYMALQNNMLIVLVSVFGQIPLGFTLAYILSRKLVKAGDFFQTMIYLPNVISPIIIGILFKSFYLNHNSLYMEVLKIFNPAVEFSMNKYPMIPVMVVILWMYTGGYVIIFLANLQRIDTAVIEAAKIDGAGEAQALWYIILPAISGVIVISAILAISGSLKVFDLLFVMTQGGPAHKTTVLSLYMYDKAFKSGVNFSVANAISTIMVIISFVLITITQLFENYFGGKE
ncbi:MAG: sugar ABC transporter permease [Treponema sp.]|jgi:raffinose/stachyose/melibiose transport system permease protein|nr:sugar ABC transporter permease [Treponema sp.]